MVCNICAAERVKRHIHPLFTWQSDKRTFGKPEYWTSFVEHARQGWAFKGDCDDYALTAADLLVDEGVSKADLMLAFCYTETNEGHLNLLVDTPQGPVAVDNRFNLLKFKIKMAGYRWVSYRRYARGHEWKEF